jgi:hypothetical protein
MGRWILAGAGALALSFAALWLSRTEELRLPAVAWSAPAPPDWANDRFLTRAPRGDQQTVSRRMKKTTEQQSPASHGGVRIAAGPRHCCRGSVKPSLSGDAAPRSALAPRVVSTGEDTALLEIPTSNPDVVLYWLVDSGGD